MHFFNYVFYCHYLLFDWLRKNDFSEAKALVIMASSNFCLLLTLLLTSEYFFRLVPNLGVAVGGMLLMLVAYNWYFIYSSRYVAIVQRFTVSRNYQQVHDWAFAVVWTLLNYFSIIIYVWLR